MQLYMPMIPQYYLQTNTLTWPPKKIKLSKKKKKIEEHCSNITPVQVFQIYMSSTQITRAPWYRTYNALHTKY